MLRRKLNDQISIDRRQPARANVVRARSILPGSRESTGLTVTPKEDATPCIAPNCAPPPTLSRMADTLVRVGLICLSSSTHLVAMPYSKLVKPVELPPGWAKLSTNPPPTGSVAPANTMGMVLVAACSVRTLDAPPANSTSGASAINSAAYQSSRSPSVAPQRVVIRTSL